MFIIRAKWQVYLAAAQPLLRVPDTVHIRGASKIKLKKVNEKRTVTVRRVIIF